MRRKSGKSIRGIIKRKTEKNMYSPNFLLCSGVLDFHGNIRAKQRKLLSCLISNLTICLSARQNRSLLGDYYHKNLLVLVHKKILQYLN